MLLKKEYERILDTLKEYRGHFLVNLFIKKAVVMKIYNSSISFSLNYLQFVDQHGTFT